MSMKNYNEIVKQCKTPREERLLFLLNQILWMAARYAHSRHTYAPGVVRQVVKELQAKYKGLEIKQDRVIEKAEEKVCNKKGYALKEDYLDDIFNKSEVE